MVERRQGGGNGALFNHKAIEGVLLVTAVDDTRDAWPDRSVWWWVWSPHRVDIVIGVVTEID